MFIPNAAQPSCKPRMAEHFYRHNRFELQGSYHHCLPYSPIGGPFRGYRSLLYRFGMFDMALRNQSKLRFALLLAVTAQGAARADDTFIVQPKLRAERPEAPISTPIEQPKLRSQSRLERPFAATNTSPGAGSSTSTGNGNGSRTNTSTSTGTGTQISAGVSMSGAAVPAAELQWVSRGTSARLASQSTRRDLSREASSFSAALPNNAFPNNAMPPLEFVHRATPAAHRLQNAQSPTAIEVQSLSLDHEPLEAADFQTVPPAADVASLDEQVPSSPPQVSAIDEEREARAVRAALVSSQIIGSASSRTGRPPARFEDITPGWQAVGERLSVHLRQCEALLRRNAFFSAREEAETGAIYLVRVLDLAGNSYHAEPRLLAAQRALTEAEDFSFSQRLTTDHNFLERVIESHQTAVLKSVDVTRMSPLVAAQHYRQFAQQSLVEACQSHPWGSEVYYMLGRTYQAQAEQGSPQADSLRWKAVTFYQAAVAIAPHNSIATNQLGFILLQMDRPQDARNYLINSVQAELNAPALENLVEVSRRLNDAATQNWALQNLAQLRRMHPNQTPAPQVTEVDPQTFIALSPYTIGPQRPMGADGTQQTANLPSNYSNQRSSR
jgi:tetratricopeptide (TPR) repeat protein